MVGETIIGVAHEFTAEEIAYVEGNEVTLAEVRELVGLTNEEMTIDAAIGGVKNKKAAEQSGEVVAGTQPE